MKKLLLISAAILAFAVAASAQSIGIKFETCTLNQALEKAKAEKKLVFVDVYATWCGPCKYMASNVFTQGKVGDYFNAAFINMKIDAESGEGPAVASKYGVRAYPTFLLLDGDGKEVGRKVGGAEADDFIAAIKKLAAAKK